MKKFRFKLQRLLDIRESHEKDIRYELASVVGRQNVLRAKQENLKMRMNEVSASASSITDQILVYGNFMDVSLRVVDEAENRIHAIQPEVDEVKLRLIEATREKKVLEKLKERRFQEYNYLLNREEFRENDDMNQKIYFRRLAGREEL